MTLLNLSGPVGLKGRGVGGGGTASPGDWKSQPRRAEIWEVKISVVTWWCRLTPLIPTHGRQRQAEFEFVWSTE